MSSNSVAAGSHSRGSKKGDPSASIGGGDDVEFAAPLASLRKQLLDRIDVLTPMWASVSARYHAAPNLEAALSAIAKDLASSINSVAASAELERQRLKSLRALVHSAIEERFDELLASLESAVVIKKNALERELLALTMLLS